MDVMKSNAFCFDPIVARPASGSFALSDSLLRRVFLALGDDRSIFGLRFLYDAGGWRNVGLFSEERAVLQRLCTQIGQGLQSVNCLRLGMPASSGFAINSPRSFEPRGAFEEIQNLFLAGMNYADGAYPEKVYTTIYFGTYNSGGLHMDPGEDTALFVIDGIKNFLLIEDGVERRYSVGKDRYLAWKAEHRHSSDNPNNDWSFSIHFAVGSPGVEGPVQYLHPGTRRHVAFTDK